MTSNRAVADASDDTTGQQQTQNTAEHKGMATSMKKAKSKATKK
jgi:hypothetical protein